MSNCKVYKMFNIFKTLFDTVRNYTNFLFLNMVITDRKASEEY